MINFGRLLGAIWFNFLPIGYRSLIGFTKNDFTLEINFFYFCFTVWRSNCQKDIEND